jgi:hypothetical protein
MECIWLLVAEPVQRLALGTTHLIPGIKGFDDPHIGLQLGKHCHLPALANFLLGLLVNVTKVSDHNIRTPTQPLLALPDAGLEQIILRHMAWRGPTDQGNQQNCRFITAQP